MRKFYLYSAILISLFCAGFALAAKTGFILFPEATVATAPLEEEEANAAACNFTVSVEMRKAQSKCGDLTNGKLTATVSGNSSYSYEWYTDTGDFLGVGRDLTNVEAGVYVVKVTDNATGCSVEQPGTVANETPAFELQLQVLNNVIGCNESNTGSIRLHIETFGDPQNINVYWFHNHHDSWPGGGGQHPDGMPRWQNVLTSDQLPAGTYTVFARNNNSHCYSDPVHITIGQLTPPVITETLTPDSYCIGGNGIISLDITTDPGPPPAGGFNISWSGPSSGTAEGVTQYDITGLEAGTYTVTVTDPSGDGDCITTETYEILDARTYPALELTSTPNTVCIPNNVNNGYDGTISITRLVEDGQEITDFSDYTFNWMNADGSPLSENTSGTPTLYEGLLHGNYLVSVVNTTTGCPSGQFPVSVALSSPTLSLQLTAYPQTFCTAPFNGAISAVASTSGNRGYTLQWFEGNSDAGTPLPAGNISGNLASNLAGDRNYFVKLIDNYTGCSTSQTIYVPRATVTPLLSATSTPNTVCDPDLTSPAISYNGTITVNVSNAIAGETFTYSWTNEDGTITGNFTGGSNNVLIGSNFAEDQYTIVATSTTTRCPSAEFIVEVGQARTNPSLSLSTNDNTACSAPWNGNATVSVILPDGTTAAPSDYTYEWFQAGVAIPGQSTEQATALGEGNYSVRVTDLATGCQSTVSGTIQSNPVDPEAGLIELVPISCSNPGQMEARVVSPVAGTSYSIIWYLGEEAIEANRIWEESNVTTSVLSTYNGRPLPSAYYTVVVVNNDTRCSSEAVTAYLAPPAPEFTLGYEINRSPNACDEELGVLTAWVENGVGSEEDLGNLYRFYWYEGRPTDPTATFFSNPPIQFVGDSLQVDADSKKDTVSIAGQSLGNGYYAPKSSHDGQTLFKARPGVYTVVVERISDECKALQEIVVDYPYAFTGTMEMSPIDECNGTGAIYALVKDAAGVVLDQRNFTFSLYRGQNPLPGGPVISPTEPAVNATDTTVYSGLEADFYTLVATDNTNCSSIAVTEELQQLSLEPLVSISNMQANQNCDTPNGTFDITVGPPAGDVYTASFDITVISSGGNIVFSLSSVLANTYSLPDTLSEGVYDILVEGRKTNGDPTGCPTNLSTTLGRNAPLPSVSASATNQTECSPANGTARVDRISFPNEADVTGGSPYDPLNFSNYTFSWYASEADYLIGDAIAGENGPEISPLEAGTYYVTARRNTAPSLGCHSAPAIVTVENVSTLPVITFSSQPQGDCGSPNGTLTATATTAGENSNNYTFSWFRGQNTDPANQITQNINQDPAGNVEHIFNLEAGFYTLLLQDGNCDPVVRSYEVESTTSQPVISGFGNPEPNTNCFDGVNIQPNGSFTVNSVTYNGTAFTNSEVDNNFVFYLYEEDPTANPAAEADTVSSSITGLAPGTYYLVTRKTSAPGIGCGEMPFVFTIEDRPFSPVFAITNGTANNACPGGTPNGSLSASISRSDGVALSPNDYSIEWTFIAENGSQSPVPAANISANQLQLTGLAAGTYQAVASLNGYGCAVTATYTLGQENFEFTLQAVARAQRGCIANGEINIDAVTINGAAAPRDEFTFNWYRKDADGTEHPIAVPGTYSLSDLEAGIYVIEGVKNNNPGGGCGPRVEVVVPYIDAMPVITVNQLRSKSGCNEESKGLIDVTVSSPIGNSLRVRWFKNSQADGNGDWVQDPNLPATDMFPSGTQIPVNNLETGYYKLTVEDPAQDIQCTITRIFFIDEQSVTAVMEPSAQDAWKCSPANGEILVMMRNRDSYSQYYPGSTFNVNIERPEDGFTQARLLDIAQTDSLLFQGLGAGVYILTYEEQPDADGIVLSGCRIPNDTLEILDSSIPVLAEIEQTNPYTVCDPSLADGELSAYAMVDGSRTTEGYSFAWYEGEVNESTTEEPIRNTAIAGGLKDTTYTVIVTRLDTGCKGVAYFTITEESIPFTPTIQQEVMLTKCDPALANAELLASVEDGNTDYSFEWFMGQADLSTPTSEAISTQARATGLRDTTYTVRVTRTSTGCQGLASHTIVADYPVIPADSSWIISKPSTSCQYANGSLEVGVDSLYTNYSFSWYNGPEAHPDSLIAMDVYRLDSLAPGTYTITITSEENGCTSAAFTKEVGEDYYFPKYVVNIKSSTCIEEGTASIVDVEGKIPFYEWYYEDKGAPIAANGPFSGPAGNYWLKIVSDLGCIKWVPVEINSVVDPYNAVTLNGDGQNDYFHIDCIEMFPENRVRIYNRAGTLVFEKNGYDNSLNSFTGFGNRGVYISGNELPVGTYFYHIDKRHKDEKPQTGFLEVLR